MSDRVQDDTAALRRNLLLRLGVKGFVLSAVGIGLVWTENVVAALVGSALFVAGSLLFAAVVFWTPLVIFSLWERKTDTRRRMSAEEKHDG
ncbi:hypothetical protein [Aeromicrobium sp. CTD01-1L150]|uniref:hypothetical protein n=1 Tax=Aeromicrobium sp. CTD01-1L150 TaxID=3341830 RepID=UPI0035C248F2